MNAMIMRDWPKVFAVCLIAFCLVSCVPVSTETSEVVTASLQPTATEPFQPELPTGVNSPFPPAQDLQVTATRYLETASPTYSQNVTPTAIAHEQWVKTLSPVPGLQILPTIESSLVEDQYYEFMQTNRGCPLPCFWGFELGRSTLSEIRQFYETFSMPISGRSWENGEFTALTITFSESVTVVQPARHYYAAVDDIIYTIYVEVGRLPNYQIEALMQQLDQPAEIWMWTHPEPAIDDIITMNFILFFPDHGTFVFYETMAERQGDYVQACFSDVGRTYLKLWLPELRNPNGDKTLSELLDTVSFVFTLENMRPIQEVSNWDVSQFYTTLIDMNHSECLETPAEIWPSRL